VSGSDAASNAKTALKLHHGFAEKTRIFEKRTSGILPWRAQQYPHQE
jgi:hypothetical protein